MTSLPTLRYAAFVLSLALADLGWGASGPALIVHDGTPGIEADVIGNLSAKLTAAGYTVTENVGIPGGSLAANKQIWDVRFNNTTPLTGGDITAYVTYLAGGGSLFVMGENTGFATRNASIVSLIQTAGGGTITVVTPANAQTVQAPFTGPTALATITYAAAAGTAATGTLSFITKDASNIGAAILYGPGALSSAPAGSLLIVFDVNFLQAGADANSQALSNNMIQYLAAPIFVPPSAAPQAQSAPTLSEWGMILLACGLFFVAFRRLGLRRAPHATASGSG